MPTVLPLEEIILCINFIDQVYLNISKSMMFITMEVPIMKFKHENRLNEINTYIAQNTCGYDQMRYTIRLIKYETNYKCLRIYILTT